MKRKGGGSGLLQIEAT